MAQSAALVRWPQRGRTPATVLAAPKSPLPLPAPTGNSPYRISLQSLLSNDEYDAIIKAGHFDFHLVGDVGGVKDPHFQLAVAAAMAGDAHEGADPARFLYIMGDVVYYNGEDDEYYPQFYEPYHDYPGPIVAVPGNHDATPITGGLPSLTAFVNNFCSTVPSVSPDARDVPRLTMTQPNVYWTLTSPLLTIVGIYDNTVEEGYVDDTQRSWLVDELRTAPRDAPLVVTSHHPMLSLDKYHGPSGYMQQLLDQAIADAGRAPDLIAAGHVHNYQRWQHTLGADRAVPFVVAGAGGYWHLHAVMAPDRTVPALPYADADGNQLLNFDDDLHGYLRVTAGKDGMLLRYYTVQGVAPTVARKQVEQFRIPLGTSN